MEAVEKMREIGAGALVVSTDTQPIAGIVSERDVVRAIAASGDSSLRAPVETIMTGSVVTCQPGDLITDIMTAMTENRFRHMPVEDGGRLAGIISIGDAVKNRLDELENEATNLRAYIATA